MISIHLFISGSLAHITQIQLKNKVHTYTQTKNKKTIGVSLITSNILLRRERGDEKVRLEFR